MLRCDPLTTRLGVDAMATYYVTTSGSDSNNGLTEGTAFATPGYAAGQATTGDIVYIKSGTYTLSNTTENTSGGPVGIKRSVILEGYDATAGDQAAKPIINAGTQAVTSVVRFVTPNYNTDGTLCRCIEVDGNNVASAGINASAAYCGTVFNCIVRNCVDHGIQGSMSAGMTINCSVYNSNKNFSGGACYLCFSDGGSYGFYGSIPNANRCIAINATADGFRLLNFTHTISACVAYNNAGRGISGTYDINLTASCLSVNNDYGFAFGNAAADPCLVDCADYNNTSGRSAQSNTSRDFRPITLTADPFVSASTGDFRINDVAGGGAELRQIQLSGLAGVNGVFDVGAIDAVVTAGGGGGGSSTPTAGTQVYPFRQWVEDDFGSGGGGGGAVLHPLRSN